MKTSPSFCCRLHCIRMFTSLLSAEFRNIPSISGHLSLRSPHFCTTLLWLFNCLGLSCGFITSRRLGPYPDTLKKYPRTLLSLGSFLCFSRDIFGQHLSRARLRKSSLHWLQNSIALLHNTFIVDIDVFTPYYLEKLSSYNCVQCSWWNCRIPSIWIIQTAQCRKPLVEKSSKYPSHVWGTGKPAHRHVSPAIAYCIVAWLLSPAAFFSHVQC